MRGEDKILHALATITQQLQYLERMVIDLQTRKVFEVSFNDVASESDGSSDGYESAPAAVQYAETFSEPERDAPVSRRRNSRTGPSDETDAGDAREE